MEDVLETCCAVAGGDSRLVWAPASWLVEQGVQEWMELPLWISRPAYVGQSAISVIARSRPGSASVRACRNGGRHVRMGAGREGAR
jgi:hypothetical protein